MLGALCRRPLIFSRQTLTLHLIHSHPQPEPEPETQILSVEGASIWRMIIPSSAGASDWRTDYLPLNNHHITNKGEGSWNVSLDARPARWLHRLDLSSLLFGLCLLLTPSPSPSPSPSFRVTGVQADGRCLFRAIAHGACLQRGEEAPDENRQRELADELRAQVVDELLKRRKEVEWFIEEDFDAYVKRIQQPYVWGGEPELLMASHVLEKVITVFMKDRSTGELRKIVDYGEEYKKEKEAPAPAPINVLFHGYGHYDILEPCSI